MASGHGTIISGADAQGDARVHVNSSSDSNYEAGYEQDAINNSGQTITPGQVVHLEWGGEHLSIVSVGNRATGDVSGNGSYITVTDSGDTGLDGEVDVAPGYDSFGGASQISFAAVDGAASYLE